MKRGHIGTLEGAMMLYIVMGAKLYLQYPGFLIRSSGPAAWQSAIVLTAGGLLLFWPTLALARRFPGRDLAEISEEAAGPIVGTLLILAVSAWLFSSMALTVRNFGEAVIIALLPTTPPSVLMFVMLGCSAYAAYRGLETLARAAQLIIPILILISVLVMAMIMPRADASRLFPILGHGLPATFSAGLYFSTMAAEAVLLVVFGSAFRKTGALARSGFWGIFLFGVAILLETVVLVMVLGAPSAAQQAFPMYNLARLLHLGRFLQRLEAVIVLFWFFGVALRHAVLLYGTAVSLAGALRLPYYQPLIFPLAVLNFAAAFIPEDFMVLLRVDRDIIRPLGFLTAAVPLLLLMMAAIRRKGGADHAA